MLKFKREKKNPLDTLRVLVQYFCLFKQFCFTTKALKDFDTTSWECAPEFQTADRVGHAMFMLDQPNYQTLQHVSHPSVSSVYRSLGYLKDLVTI